jgi:hypothetical protein
MSPLTPHPSAGLDTRASHPGGLPGCGAASARVGSLNLASGSAQDANLPTSDYQEPQPDGAGYDRTLHLISADTSRRYVLVPDVDGCFR